MDNQFHVNAVEYMYEKLMPDLDAAVREVFNPLAYEQDVDAEYVREMAAQRDHFKKFVNSYTNRLIELYVGFQVDVYGDKASKKEFQAKFRSE